ncbi:MAG: FGGY family carbohydrate kinase [Propioniciclava sp.]
MTLVAGIDSSTQSCKVTIRELASGREIRHGKALHPPGTIVDPDLWWLALLQAVDRAGGLADVSAVSVSGQQHTPIFLDAHGDVVCNSPLWNDTGSHPQLMALNNELGRDEWIRRTGLPITLSDTVTKLRWLRDMHPQEADRTAAVAIVHDWLTWRLRGYGPDDHELSALTTDRSEASGTGYWSPDTESYCPDLVEHALGQSADLPRILMPTDSAGTTGGDLPGIPAGITVGIGSGDNAAAALALGLAAGDAVLSLGTSGVVYTRSATPVHDYAGYVCNYADALGEYLPLVATLNAARNLDAGATVLGCTYEELAQLALQAPAGAAGLTVLPYFEGERTPDLPTARASLHGASLTNLTRANVARAVIEGTVVSQVAMLDALAACGIHPSRLLLIGGAAGNPAVQVSLAQSVNLPVLLPAAEEYVARGAALQAAAALEGGFRKWPIQATALPSQPPNPHIREQHAAAQAAMGYRPVS